MPWFKEKMCLVLLGGVAWAQAPKMTKVDPPNWWARMPKPMLLVQGGNLQGARFSVSDRGVRVEKTHVSENGHWAELWLSASPEKAETGTVVAESAGGEAGPPCRLWERRGGGEWVAGVPPQ